MYVLPPLAQASYTLSDGRTVEVINPVEAQTLWGEIHDDPHSPYQVAAAGLTEGDVILDVGAHIGLASLCFAGQAPAARIIAVEPAPKTFACLQANLSRYVPTATAVGKAVGAAPGAAELTFRPYIASASSLYDDSEDEARNMEAYFVNSEADAEGRTLGWRAFNVRETVTVEVTTLAEIMETHAVQRVGLLKIDVERGELEVLRGMNDSAWPMVARVFLEVHDIGGRLGDVTGLLASRGYQVNVSQTPVFRGGSVYLVRAVRP